MHAVTRRVPAEMLAEELLRLHALPAAPYTLAFGECRIVGVTTPMVAHDHCQYSAPSELRGEAVWVREHGDEIVIVSTGRGGAREVARHQRTVPGEPRIDASHFPPEPPGALARTPVPRTPAERDFLAIGPGAALWLTEAGMAGVARVRVKMARAVTLARLTNPTRVDWALGHAATQQRFGENDLESILEHGQDVPVHAADEASSLQTTTAVWAGFTS